MSRCDADANDEVGTMFELGTMLEVGNRYSADVVSLGFSYMDEGDVSPGVDLFSVTSLLIWHTYLYGNGSMKQFVLESLNKHCSMSSLSVGSKSMYGCSDL